VGINLSSIFTLIIIVIILTLGGREFLEYVDVEFKAKNAEESIEKVFTDSVQENEIKQDQLRNESVTPPKESSDRFEKFRKKN
jgi:hypothetical protein